MGAVNDSNTAAPSHLQNKAVFPQSQGDFLSKHP